jgi:hypothetical protein
MDEEEAAEREMRGRRIPMRSSGPHTQSHYWARAICCTKLETLFAWRHLSISPRALHPGMFVSFVPANDTASRGAE